MIKGMQDLVNAQVDVNRAVFDANATGRNPKGSPRPEYIKKCVEDAIQSLQDCLKKMDAK